MRRTWLAAGSEPALPEDFFPTPHAPYTSDGEGQFEMLVSVMQRDAVRVHPAAPHQHGEDLIKRRKLRYGQLGRGDGCCGVGVQKAGQHPLLHAAKGHGNVVADTN